MTLGKKIALGSFLAVSALIYYYEYRGYLTKPDITIRVSVRPRIPRRGARPAVPPPENVTFSTDENHQLTSIKVIPVGGLKTNQQAQPVWEMASESNSIPLNIFAYGNGIRGMHSVPPNAKAQPLAAGEEYRIIIKSRSVSGQHDFKMPEEQPADTGGAN
jgi:hypothetical protein